MEDQNNNGQQGKININLSAEVADGIYSNMALITHSDTEFVLDFIRVVPGVPSPSVKSRIIMTPENAKKLLMALKDNIDKYESKHGGLGANSVSYPFGLGGKGNA